MARQDPTPDATQWMTLTEAADALRVHPTTLRRWADSGQVPVFLTPGGHRRFAASDVRHIAVRRHAVRKVGPVERIWADQALAAARQQLAAQESERWLKQHDGGARDRNRQMGHQLMGLILAYLTDDDDDGPQLAQARSIGTQYGNASRDLGLPLSDALRAAMFFRDALTTSAVQLPENVRIPTGSQVRLVMRINRIVNEVQLGVADAYAAS
ncbi:MAG TPA: helix-turn-helix domain-containing protein [Candidatus Krumholzibacteria bacterium]|nr:helix-turn-helix domain-containing protein [Candidatus Krumholzibacteria bacterium]